MKKPTKKKKTDAADQCQEANPIGAQAMFKFYIYQIHNGGKNNLKSHLKFYSSSTSYSFFAPLCKNKFDVIITPTK